MTGLIITAAMLVQPTWVPKSFEDGRVNMALSSDKDCKTPIESTKMSLRVADSDIERAQGLSGKALKLAKDEGMIFLPAPDDTGGSFWMKETYLPLSIAFFDAKGLWIHHEEMPVEKDPSNPKKLYAPRSTYSFAVEMPKGWFSARAKMEKSSYLCVLR